MDILIKKSMLFLSAMIVFVLLIFSNSPLAITDDAISPSEYDSSYKTEPAENIGAWYDEVWEAAGFYSTGAASHHTSGSGPASVERWELRYHYTDTPEGETVTEDGAYLGPDAVVVEWKVSGHVHFASGL